MKKGGAYLVLFKNNKRNEVFLVRRDDYYTWVLTGGGIEEDEKPSEAAIREAEEETGFKVKMIRPLGIYEIINSQGKKLRKSYLYEGRVISGKFKPEFPGCLGRWFALEKLPKDMSAATRKKIIDAKNHQKSSIFRKKRQEDRVWENFHLLFMHPIGVLNFLYKRLKNL